MINVILIARYPTIRTGLASVLKEDGSIAMVAETGHLERIPELIEEHLPDALLIDLVDEPADSLTVFRELDETMAHPALVLISGSATDALDAVAISRASLLLRDATAEEILTAIRTSRTGLVTLDPRIASAIGDQLATGAVPPEMSGSTVLTPREMDVMRAVAHGLPNKGISRELGISEHTVKFHLGSIFQKLDVSSRSEAIIAAVRLGLLDPRG